MAPFCAARSPGIAHRRSASARRGNPRTADGRTCSATAAGTRDGGCTSAKRPAIRDIAFSIESGEVFGFFRPSGGTSKSTRCDESISITIRAARLSRYCRSRTDNVGRKGDQGRPYGSMLAVRIGGGTHDMGTVCVALIARIRPTSLPIPEPNTAAVSSRDSRDPRGCRMPS